jgi:hypothetical protein
VVDEAPVAKGGKRGGFKGKAAAKAAAVAAPTTPKAVTLKAAAPTSEERSRRTPTPSAKVLAALADAVVVSPVLVAVRENTLPPPEIVKALTFALYYFSAWFFYFLKFSQDILFDPNAKITLFICLYFD